MKKIIKKMIIVSAMLGCACSMNNVDAANFISDDISSIDDVRMIEAHKALELSTVDSRMAGQVLGGNGHSPEGVITSFYSPSNDKITLSGKVFDRDAMDKPVTLQVYIGNDLGGSARFTVPSNKTFTYTYNVRNVPGKQAYTVYAIDEYGNNRKDSKIASGTVYVNGNFEHRPQGKITSFYSPAANQITLTGKVYDMDDMNKNVELHVYIGNDLGGSDKFTVPPNQDFSHTYNVKNVPGRQAYTVWAIDDYGPNRENYVIARGTVDVKTTPVPPPPTPTATTYRVSTNSLNLNLRSGMSNTASIIAKMPTGSIVTGTDQGNGWARVTYNGMTGYASMQYLSPANVNSEYIWPLPSSRDVGTTYYYAKGGTHSSRWYLNGKSCAIDIRTGGQIGRDVVAIADGTVISVIDKGSTSFGKYIIIQHDNGKQSLYAHLNEFKVSKNQRVSKGQLIAKSGNTGNSTGPHLHFEISGTDTFQYYKLKGML